MPALQSHLPCQRLHAAAGWGPAGYGSSGSRGTQGNSTCWRATQWQRLPISNLLPCTDDQLVRWHRVQQHAMQWWSGGKGPGWLLGFWFVLCQHSRHTASAAVQDTRGYLQATALNHSGCCCSAVCQALWQSSYSLVLLFDGHNAPSAPGPCMVLLRAGLAASCARGAGRACPSCRLPKLQSCLGCLSAVCC